MKSLFTMIQTVFFISLLLGLSGCSKKGPETTSIQIKGSDTEVNLVQRLAEVFMEEHPDVPIAVTGGGSGTGISAIINKQTDIANSSRAIKQDELDQAKGAGVDPVGIVFALDGLAIIVNQTMTLDSITLDQLARVFKGEMSNWSGLGGPDKEVSIYGRQSNSGTYIYFRDNVLKGDYSPKARRMNGTAQIVEAIKTDTAGIGYVGIGYAVGDEGEVVSGIKVLKIARDETTPAVSPLEPENVKSGLYPLSRPLYQFTNGRPEGRLLEFIRFELSEKGQAIVGEQGSYPVTPDYIKQNKSVAADLHP